MYVELLTLLRCVHDIFGNQDVADLPHFRKNPTSISSQRVPLSHEITLLIWRWVPHFRKDYVPKGFSGIHHLLASLYKKERKKMIPFI